MTKRAYSRPSKGKPVLIGQIPIVYASGGPAEIGFQIGRDRRQQVEGMIETYHHLFKMGRQQIGIENWEQAKDIARGYLHAALESVPSCVEEMRGLAEGAAVPFGDILVLNCMEALTSDALQLGCTSMAIAPEMSVDGSTLVAHNEDWQPEDLGHVYLVHVRPTDEPAFLGLTYGGLLPNIGFNECGIAQCCDSVYPNDARVGVPRVLVSRRVLAGRTLGEAIKAALHPNRAAGYNHLIVHQSGEMYCVEASATAFELLYADDGMLVHTNHYLSERMKAIERRDNDLISSRIRHNRACHLLLSQKGQATQLSLKAILSDHMNYPEAICNHTIPQASPLERQQTITSLVIDLARLTMFITLGNPCESEYYPCRLQPTEETHQREPKVAAPPRPIREQPVQARSWSAQGESEGGSTRDA